MDILAELRAKEELLLTPALRQDRAAVENLLTEDFMEFGSSGRVWTRDQILDLLATEAYTPPHAENFACALLDENVALLTYRTIRDNPETGSSVTTLRTSIWTKKSGEWRVRFHQGTAAA